MKYWVRGRDRVYQSAMTDNSCVGKKKITKSKQLYCIVRASIYVVLKEKKQN
jgi:hypothetical protein